MRSDINWNEKSTYSIPDTPKTISYKRRKIITSVQGKRKRRQTCNQNSYPKSCKSCRGLEQQNLHSTYDMLLTSYELLSIDIAQLFFVPDLFR